MAARSALRWAGWALVAACSCGPKGPAILPAIDPSRLARLDPEDARLGGSETVLSAAGDVEGRDAFSYPFPSLDPAGRRAFAVGNALFRQNWVPAPASTEGRDGLGPLFIARSCSSCHLEDGRGRPPDTGEDPGVAGFIVKLGERSPDGAVRPHAVYGSVVRTAANPGIRPEARIEIVHAPVPGSYSDGERYTLDRPSYRLLDAAYGPPGDVVLSPRVASQLIGIGLLERVPEPEILRFADPDDADGDGISGRPNRVNDVHSGELRLGRFGWKANQPSIEQQVATALSGDLGLTTSLFPSEPLSDEERSSMRYFSGGEPEVDDHKVERITVYCATLAVPAERDTDTVAVRRGRYLAEAIGCTGCHRAELPVDASDSAERIHPYTDLLLHDMGPDLADGFPDGAASGREWRTPPLWGIGLFAVVNDHARYLHDGRARGLAEAILWHGGEAERSRDRFRSLDAEDRASLLAFLRSL